MTSYETIDEAKILNDKLYDCGLLAADKKLI